MIMFLLALIACDETTTSTTGTLTFHEMEVTFEDRYGVVQAPGGEILSVSACAENAVTAVLMCTSTSWGIGEQGSLFVDLQSEDHVGVVKYATQE